MSPTGDPPENMPPYTVARKTGHGLLKAVIGGLLAIAVLVVAALLVLQANRADVSEPQGAYQPADMCADLDQSVRASHATVTDGPISQYLDPRPGYQSQPDRSCQWQFEDYQNLLSISTNVFADAAGAKAYFDSVLASYRPRTISGAELDSTGKVWKQGWAGTVRSAGPILLAFAYDDNAFVIAGARVPEARYQQFTDPAGEWAAMYVPLIDQTFELMRK